jgi:MoxR-like ATPase
LAHSLAASLNLEFSRIQFTPDLLPGDIVGMTIWKPDRQEFIFKQGAVMHQFVLADEINRASPRTQSSLLEAMQENTVTVDGKTYPLPQPFFVVATQNPSHFSGAFQLPEGEVDRFGISFSIGYPEDLEEQEILARFQASNPLPGIEPVLFPQELIEIREAVRSVTVSQAVREYLICVVKGTRNNPYIQLGASPRASQQLQRAAQGNAVLQGRNYTIPEDVKKMAVPVLAHRIIPSAEAKMADKSTVSLIREIVDSCRMPVGLS